MLGHLEFYVKKENEFDPLPHIRHLAHQKRNSRWIIGLNVNAKTIKLCSGRHRDKTLQAHLTEFEHLHHEVGPKIHAPFLNENIYTWKTQLPKIT